jgi:glycosyltransferase involved in cell wall biosynthesis
MELLLVSDAFPPSFGGVERHVYTLSKFLNKRGLDITVLTEALNADDRELQKSGITIKRDIKFDRRKSALQWTYQYIQNSKKIRDAINEHGNDYDIIHYHGTHMLYMDKIDVEPPLIATIHGIFPSCIAFWGIEDWCRNNPTPYNCAICMLKIRKSYAPIIPGMLLYNKYYLDRMKKSLKRLDKLISVSDYVKNIVKEAYKLENITTKYNFIDIKNDLLSRIKPGTNMIEYDLDPNKDIILFSGRLHPQKGISTLIESFNKIEKPNVELLITGKGELESLVKKQSAENSNIKYLGYLPRDIQINLLSQSRLFVAPSTYPDACPTAIIEAMALGIPVVSTYLGGIPELVLDGETGYLTEPNNPDSLKTKIIKILAKEKGYFSENCKKQAKKFDINNIGEEIIKLYKTLIEN